MCARSRTHAYGAHTCRHTHYHGSKNYASCFKNYARQW